MVPAGTCLTGALFFRQGVNLYVAEGGMLKGSDDIADYPVLGTRIEGETCPYFAALINADGLDGFTMCGARCDRWKRTAFLESILAAQNMEPEMYQ